jgi:hypothetical protein
MDQKTASSLPQKIFFIIISVSYYCTVSTIRFPPFPGPFSHFEYPPFFTRFWLPSMPFSLLPRPFFRIFFIENFPFYPLNFLLSIFLVSLTFLQKIFSSDYSSPLMSSSYTVVHSFLPLPDPLPPFPLLLEENLFNLQSNRVWKKSSSKRIQDLHKAAHCKNLLSRL